MALHLIKLCVGADTPEDLRAPGGRGAPPPVSAIFVHTRQTPKRAAELLDGGSIYWVFKGVILTRQRILRVETVGEGVQKRCEIFVDDELIPTAPQPRRAFQGWRYLETKDAPADMSMLVAEGVPADLARQLRELGAW